MRVAICGGGVIGACIAYFLAQKGAEPVLIERHEVGGAASGKSGGFLALDWCDGSPLEALARRSFALHADLAEQHGNPWGYRRLETYSVVASAKRDLSVLAGRAASLDWLQPGALVQGRLGHEQTTAQITPADFTKGLAELAFERGAVMERGTVTGLALTSDGSGVRGVEIDGVVLEADTVVLALGPWMALARDWLPLPVVHGLKGHSVVLRPSTPVPAHALFAEFENREGGQDSPEVYPRPDGTVYLCGLSGQEALPDDPADVSSGERAVAQLRGMARALSPALADADILASQACYRPVTQDGVPLLGAVPGIDGVFLATGHSVWGML
ncbi:MAG: FAD-binding oxidoreductase, partial [Pseudomonadota bacterium]